jgi:predicted enzyme related to lactoylglutathione lyase
MGATQLRFVGVELYFGDLEKAKDFYTNLLKLPVGEEQPGHFAKLDFHSAFVCLERKGSENYPSQDKAVLFFEAENLNATIAEIGSGRFLRIESAWAVLHDPEGHNVLILEAGGRTRP